MTDPFAALTPLRYNAILADPPWRFRTWSAKGEGKSPSAHYVCMPVAEIAALPVGHLARADCLLVLWATAPMLDKAFEVMRAWDFAFKSSGAWAKQSRTGRKWAFGGGYVVRSAAEFFLLGAIGKPRLKSRGERNLIAAPVREHSRKPDEMYAKIEALVDGPYLELFARQRRPGWDAWGNETDKFGETP